MTNVIKIETTFSQEADAKRAADQLLERRLAACVQIIGPIASHYRWEGKLETSNEWLVAIKTTTTRYPQVAAALNEIHPYDTPEILAFACVDGAPNYLAWVEQSVE